MELRIAHHACLVRSPIGVGRQLLCLGTLDERVVVPYGFGAAEVPKNSIAMKP